MLGTSHRLWLVVCALAGCGTGDNKIDPSDLELRDVLGIAPATAASWDAPQRASARRVLVAGLRETAPTERIAAGGDSVAAIAALDAARAARGADALGAIELSVDGGDVVAIPRPASLATATIAGDSHPTVELLLAAEWDADASTRSLVGRGLDVFGALATDLGHEHGKVIVAPAPQLAAIAAYMPGAEPRLIVNPVLVAALEPDSRVSAGEGAVVTTALAPSSEQIARTAGSDPGEPSAVPGAIANIGGNAYSFYGSYEECAAAQRARCETCLANSSCTPITNTSDGNAECTMLAANDGRGYYLECINLALAITSVQTCTKSAAPACPQTTNAADMLGELEVNAMFLDDSTCAAGLNGCLAKIYGAPGTTYPDLVDGGTAPSPVPPRSTNTSSCSNNQNCQASPNCSCSGPSCNNSLSCDSGCSSGAGKGCGGACSSSSGGGNTGGGCSSGSGGSSGGSCSGGSCSGGSSSGSSGGGCNSCSGGSSSSSSGGGCSGGSCGGSSSSGGSSCGGGSSGGGKCSVAADEPNGTLALVVSLVWAFLPVPIAGFVRRRARKHPKPSADEEVAS